MNATMRGDRHAHPQEYEYRLLTLDECKGIKSESHCKILDKNGQIATVKITSVKTWKTRPNEVVIGWKFGLYEFGKEWIVGNDPEARGNAFFIRVLETEESTYRQTGGENPDSLMEDSADPQPCPICNGQGNPMGALGKTQYYRCESCGWQFIG